MSLRRIDPNDDAQLSAWYAVFARSHSLTGIGGQWQQHEFRALATTYDAPFLSHLLAYDVDGVVVAVSNVVIINAPGRRSVRGDLQVDPPRRRQGHGSAALRDLEEYARSLGYLELVLGANEGELEVGTGPSRSFAPAHGYVLADEYTQRVIAWPRPAGELDRLEARWRPHATDYEIVCFASPTPPRWRDERVRVRSLMATDAPHANQVVEEEVWTDDILRFYEERTTEMGRDMHVVLAHHVPSGTVAGYSELVIVRDNPALVQQYDTLVTREHRGHRLGGLMKVANMRVLESLDLPFTGITTFNSNINGPMIAVNVALGATTAAARIHWRRDL